ncbi:di-N-acetylchitobiase-like isoform X1 [Podarcis raffonei]|uniref:di-N-acetylchitobiase-like isoform X1 n=2 Tax=Podarcis raffonei TaxID=65483 RepID=UPI0023291FBB|nr:di-N-acetylchitobiase-like isoform X1 [Podarcis raffonei]
MGRLLGGRDTHLLAALLLRLWLGSGTCPCENPVLCNPISESREFEVRRNKVPYGNHVGVFVFDVGGKTWKFYDWSQITTVAAFGKYDPELMCYAHSKGSRVVLKGDIPLKKIVNPAARTAWINHQVALAKRQYMDGINIDIEQQVKKYSAKYYALTALVEEMTEAFHKEIPGSQVTFDVPWCPECIYKRVYNYTGIANSCDFVFVMSYDEQSQMWSHCILGANAPYNQTLAGYDNYIRIGINPKKLVMGVPWYGYDYTCRGLSKDHVCSVAKIPFRGAPCSDPAGHQVPYKAVMKQIVPRSLSGILWDKEQKAPYVEYKDPQGAFHQVWFDDPRSISLKAAYVKKRGLRGIGMWHADCLSYSGDLAAQGQTAAMWEALKPK